MAYVPIIPDWFLTKKAAQVTAYFLLKAGGELNILKATKLIYLADRESMRQRDYAITNDQYVSMPFGPVNSYTYSYMQGAAPARQEDWLEYISPRLEKSLRLSRQISADDLDELSLNDIRIMDEVWGQFAGVDRFDLAEWTHIYCPEWRDPHGSSLPIELTSIFSALKKNNPVDLIEDVQTERAMINKIVSS